MKKILLGLLTGTLLFSNSLEDRVSTLEKEVSGLKEVLAAYMQLKKLTNKNKKPKEEQKNTTSKCKLELESWTKKIKKDKWDEYVVIDYTLKNTHNKSIKLIDGAIQFEDLLGEKIMRIGIEKDVKIPSKKIQKLDGYYSIGYGNSQRMKTVKKEDIKATLEIDKLVLKDNTIIECKK